MSPVVYKHLMAAPAGYVVHVGRLAADKRTMDKVHALPIVAWAIQEGGSEGNSGDRGDDYVVPLVLGSGGFLCPPEEYDESDKLVVVDAEYVAGS